jgi:hypothetical protein
MSATDIVQSGDRAGMSMTAAHSQPSRRRISENDILLGLLDAVERDPGVTQRSVARDLGIALGLANAYLRGCVRKGLIKVGQAPARRYVYYLTPQGFAEKSRLTASYLSRSFSFLREARAHCALAICDAQERSHRRLVLIGGGELADIARLVAREHAVEIAGTVVASADPGVLATGLAGLGELDAALVTAIENPQEAFEAALNLFGPDRVYVPALLRIRHRTAQPAKAGLRG